MTCIGILRGTQTQSIGQQQDDIRRLLPKENTFDTFDTFCFLHVRVCFQPNHLPPSPFHLVPAESSGTVSELSTFKSFPIVPHLQSLVLFTSCLLRRQTGNRKPILSEDSHSGNDSSLCLGRTIPLTQRGDFGKWPCLLSRHISFLFDVRKVQNVKTSLYRSGSELPPRYMTLLMHSTSEWVPSKHSSRRCFHTFSCI